MRLLYQNIEKDHTKLFVLVILTESMRIDQKNETKEVGVRFPANFATQVETQPKSMIYMLFLIVNNHTNNNPSRKSGQKRHKSRRRTRSPAKQRYSRFINQITR